ncbi:hypothetical protein ACVWWG_005016 [Bradyrhizobium sp. LB7.2]
MPQSVWRPLHPPQRLFDSSPGWESVRISFIVNRPPQEAEFDLVRQEVGGRAIRYTTVRRQPARAST